MPELTDLPVENLSPSQAAELALLVELEACWENLRPSASPAPDLLPTLRDLQGRQKAYEAFRAKLAGYNKRYRSVHISELLLNTPVRLGKWCRAMRELFLRVEGSPEVSGPVHLTEKALRWADRVAVKTGTPRVEALERAKTVRDAIQTLETISQWCDDLNRVSAVRACPPDQCSPHAPREENASRGA